MEGSGRKIITLNRRARHNYIIEETLETGISLAGTEVKSLRLGAVNLKDSYCLVKNGELFIEGMHISPYEKGNIFNKEPERTRKLLAHKREIMRLASAVQRDGYALIPLSLYFKQSRVKVELAIAKGKKLYDKRESVAQRDAGREMDRVIKERGRK